MTKKNVKKKVVKGGKKIKNIVNYSTESLRSHLKTGGKIELVSKFQLKNKHDLSVAYTPGVAAVCLEIAEKNKKNQASGASFDEARKYTLKKNTIAVVTDGSAVLGLGNIGPSAAIPVMEGKAVLMKHFAGVDAFPVCLNTQNTEEIVQTIKNLEPVFGGINLEDIAAPRCFEIEERLKKEMYIPVMHDDQWGAATVALAAFINALKLTKKKKETVMVGVSGAGAAGIATIRLLAAYGVKNIVTFDTEGAIFLGRVGKGLSGEKQEVAVYNIQKISGDLHENIHLFDVFIGLSKPGILTREDVSKMKKNPIIFALANPTPEIMPDEAYAGGAAMVATGRSDFPNQINNSVFFPGFWRGALDAGMDPKLKTFDYSLDLFVSAAQMLAKSVKNVDSKNILPSTLDKDVHGNVANAVKKYFLKNK